MYHPPLRGRSAARGNAIVEMGRRRHAASAHWAAERDGVEQTTYLGELLDILEAEGVDTAFVITLAPL